MAETVLGINIAGENLLVAPFVYYFIGMCLSRIGSLVIEPILKSMGLVRFSDYGNFVEAERLDSKISALLETANFYRTILGGVFTFVVLGLCLLLVQRGVLSSNSLIWITVISVLALTLFGYRKQVNYINYRVEKVSSSNGNS